MRAPLEHAAAVEAAALAVNGGMFYVLPVMGSVLCRDVDRMHVERTAIRMLYRKDNSEKYGKRDFMSSSTTAKLKLAILNDLLEYGWSNGCIPFRLRA